MIETADRLEDIRVKAFDIYPSFADDPKVQRTLGQICELLIETEHDARGGQVSPSVILDRLKLIQGFAVEAIRRYLIGSPADKALREIIDAVEAEAKSISQRARLEPQTTGRLAPAIGHPEGVQESAGEYAEASRPLAVGIDVMHFNRDFNPDHVAAPASPDAARAALSAAAQGFKPADDSGDWLTDSLRDIHELADTNGLPNDALASRLHKIQFVVTAITDRLDFEGACDHVRAPATIRLRPDAWDCALVATLDQHAAREVEAVVGSTQRAAGLAKFRADLCRLLAPGLAVAALVSLLAGFTVAASPVAKISGPTRVPAADNRGSFTFSAAESVSDNPVAWVYLKDKTRKFPTFTFDDGRKGDNLQAIGLGLGRHEFAAIASGVPEGKPAGSPLGFDVQVQVVTIYDPTVAPINVVPVAPTVPVLPVVAPPGPVTVLRVVLLYDRSAPMTPAAYNAIFAKAGIYPYLDARCAKDINGHASWRAWDKDLTAENEPPDWQAAMVAARSDPTALPKLCVFDGPRFVAARTIASLTDSIAFLQTYGGTMTALHVIDDSTPDSELFHLGKGRGLDLSDRPRGAGYGGVANPFPPGLSIPRADWQAMIAEAEQLGTRIPDLCDRAGLTVRDQKRTNYCWINATTHCTEIRRMLQNEPRVPLSAASAGAQITDYRNANGDPAGVGGWGKPGLEWIVAHGIVPTSLWPNNTIDPKYATAAALAEARKYRPIDWYELEPGNIDQVVSLVLRGIPVAVGYDWWGHEVTIVAGKWLDGDIALEFDNSWGLGYGTNGRGVLQGHRMYPADSVALIDALAA